jgi:hypothetical protein
MYNNPSFTPDTDNCAAKYQKTSQGERAVWDIFQVGVHFHSLLDKAGKIDTTGLPPRILKPFQGEEEV